jgi:hypothetical protein
VPGNITGEISGHAFSGRLSSYLIVNDASSATVPGPVDVIIVAFTTGDYGDPTTSVSVSVTDTAGARLTDDSFVEIDDLSGWTSANFNLLKLLEDPANPGICFATLNSVASGTVDSSSVSIDALLDSLVSAVVALNVQSGISNSLDAKLDAALSAIDDLNSSNDRAAVNSLFAFVSAVEAQRNKAIPEADACSLIRQADALIVAMGGTSTGSTCL